jgi:tetratricopeptide (TPR) repeat protein
MILAGILLLEPAIFIATTFPNTITYHNAIVGGVNGAYGNYEMDYYYNSLKQCSDWFKENELKKYKNTDTIVIATNAAHLESQYFKNIKNVKIVYTRYRERNEKPWDYAIFHIALIPAEEIRAKTWYPENSLFISKVNDNPLSAVYKRPSQDDIRGHEALRNNKPDEAVHYFAEYLKHDPKNIGMLTMIGNILLQMNKVDSAAIYVKKAYYIDPTNIDTRKMMGLVAISQGKANDAITIFRSIIEENDQYVEAYFYLGLSLEATGNHQEAINNLNTAAQEPSLAPRCYQVMGDIFTKMNNPDKAQQMYQAAYKASRGQR